MVGLWVGAGRGECGGGYMAGQGEGSARRDHDDDKLRKLEASCACYSFSVQEQN